MTHTLWEKDAKQLHGDNLCLQGRFEHIARLCVQAEAQWVKMDFNFIFFNFQTTNAWQYDCIGNIFSLVFTADWKNRDEEKRLLKGLIL